MTEQKIITFEEHIKFAKKMLVENGSVTTQMVVPTPKGLEMYMLMFDDDKSKDEMLKAMRLMVQVRNFDRYFVMNEGWMGSNLNLKPSKDPKRKEGLMIFEFKRDGNNKGKIFMFHKEEEKIIFDEEMDMNNMADFYSRFNFFLEDVSSEKIKKARIEQTMEAFDEKVPDEKIQEMFNMIKKIKPDIVEGKTWQDMKDVMVKMIKDGKVGPPIEDEE